MYTNWSFELKIKYPLPCTAYVTIKLIILQAADVAQCAHMVFIDATVVNFLVFGVSAYTRWEGNIRFVVVMVEIIFKSIGEIVGRWFIFDLHVINWLLFDSHTFVRCF